MYNEITPIYAPRYVPSTFPRHSWPDNASSATTESARSHLYARIRLDKARTLNHSISRSTAGALRSSLYTIPPIHWRSQHARSGRRRRGGSTRAHIKTRTHVIHSAYAVSLIRCTVSEGNAQGVEGTNSLLQLLPLSSFSLFFISGSCEKNPSACVCSNARPASTQRT